MRNYVPYIAILGRKLTGVVASAAATLAITAGMDLKGAQSQAESRAPAFDVASVKPAAIWQSGGEGSNRSQIEYSPTSLSMRNVDLGECVQWAYSVKFYQVSGAGLRASERYDILAKTDSSVPVRQLRAMLQNLLEKRFRLTLHSETKIIPVYDLVVSKGGPKLPAPKADVSPAHATESLPRVQDGSFVFQDTSVAEFAAKLSDLRGIDRPVVDQTSIQGVFDITLKSAARAMLQPDGPSLFTLVQEQLGLKLVASKGPVKVLVIDRVGKPSEN